MQVTTRAEGAGHRWHLVEGEAVRAIGAGLFPSVEAAVADGEQFLGLAALAGYEVLEDGAWWSWRAWHDSQVVARGDVFRTADAARAAASLMRTSRPDPGGSPGLRTSRETRTGVPRP